MKDWVTANVVGNHEVLVKVPAWIFPMFPDMPDHERSFTAIKRQVHSSVEKSLNNALSIFDPENDKPLGESGLEARRWCFYKLDFSGVEGVGELSSKDVFDRAGPNEKLDFDLIEGTGDTILGFKVGVRDPSGGGRKIQRTGGPQMSEVERKRREKLEREAAREEQEEDEAAKREQWQRDFRRQQEAERRAQQQQWEEQQRRFQQEQQQLHHQQQQFQQQQAHAQQQQAQVPQQQFQQQQQPQQQFQQQPQSGPMDHEGTH